MNPNESRELRTLLRSVALRACPIFRQMLLWMGGFPDESPNTLHSETVKNLRSLLKDLEEEEKRGLAEAAARDVARTANPEADTDDWEEE